VEVMGEVDIETLMAINEEIKTLFFLDASE